MGMGEVGGRGGRWVYGMLGVHGEMAYRLSVVESSGGKDASPDLCCTRSRRRQRAVVGLLLQHGQG